MRAGAERGRAEMARLEARLVALEAQAAEFDAQATGRRAEVDGVTVEERAAVAEAEAAEAARRRSRRPGWRRPGPRPRETASAEQVWAARAEALALALAESAGSAGADRLAGVAGVLGPLAELVEVDKGWEDAWTAAAAELAHTVVVDGVGAARQVLRRPRRRRPSSALGAPSTPPPALPAGCPGEPLRAHVRSSHPGVERALDVLLAGAVVVAGGWAEALDVSLAHPEVVALTRAGDRFGATAWRRGNTGTAATRVALDEARAPRPRRPSPRRRPPPPAWPRSPAEAERAVAAAKEAAHRRDVGRPGRPHGPGRPRPGPDPPAGDAGRGRGRALPRRAAGPPAGARGGPHRPSWPSCCPVLEAEEAAGAEEAARLAAARAEVQERIVRPSAASAPGSTAGHRPGRPRRPTWPGAWPRSRTGWPATAPSGRRAGVRRQQIELLDAPAPGASPPWSTTAWPCSRPSWPTSGPAGERQAQALATASGRLEELRRRRQDAERRLEEVRERFRRAELDEAEARMRQEAAVETLRRELDCEPDAAIAAECPRAEGRHQPGQPGPGAGAGAAADGPGQPPGPRGAGRAAGAPRLPRCPARRRQGHPPGADQGHPGRRDRDGPAAGRRLRRRRRPLRPPVRDPVPRRPGPPAPHRPRQPARGRASRWRPGRRARTSASCRCSPAASGRWSPWPSCSPCSAAGPSPFYLLDEVEAALDDVNLHPLPRPAGRVPPGGPAAGRHPPEADHGGGRLPVRGHHAARRLLAGRERAGRPPTSVRPTRDVGPRGPCQDR